MKRLGLTATLYGLHLRDSNIGEAWLQKPGSDRRSPKRVLYLYSDQYRNGPPRSSNFNGFIHYDIHLAGRLVS